MWSQFWMMTALVVSLLQPCGPADVARLVSAPGIDAIDRVAWTGAFPDVRQKRGEIVSPFRSDLDTHAAVAMVCLVVRVRAPLVHLLPRTVLRCSLSAMLVAESSREYLPQVTTARRRSPTAQVSSSDDGDSTAVTLAHPAPLLVPPFFRRLDDKESFEALSDQIELGVFRGWSRS